MKRRLVIFISVFLLLTCLSAAVSALEGSLPFVMDKAGLLTREQVDALDAKASDISSRYDLGVYILVLDDYRKYSDCEPFYQAAVDIYDSNNLGIGRDHAGTMLLLSMEERDYDLDFNSARADYAFTEAGRDRLEQTVVSYLKKNQYYNAFDAYLTMCDTYLLAAENGKPVGQEAPSPDRREDAFLLMMVFGGVAAVVTGLILLAPMHSAGKKRDANAYVEGRLNLTRRSDMFLRRTVTRTPKASSSGSGSGGSHYSSGSHSGRSGKF